MVNPTRLGASNTGFKRGEGFESGRTLGVGGGMVTEAVGAFNFDGVATSWNWTYISFFHTTLVTTSVIVAGMGSGADGAAGELLFA